MLLHQHEAASESILREAAEGKGGGGPKEREIVNNEEE